MATDKPSPGGQEFKITASGAPARETVVQIKDTKEKAKIPRHELTPAAENPWRKETRWSKSGLAVYFIFLIVYFDYIIIRGMYTLTGGLLWYSILVYAFEVTATLSMLVHGLTLLRRRKEKDPNKPLPPPPNVNWNIRVMVPCYTEALPIVKETILAAANALLPEKCRRTVYLLDDGKDKDKAAWIASLKRDDIVYISGRVRQKGETNGKACNLNNTLNNLYPPGKEVDPTELIVVFDADMVCVPEFYIKILPEIYDPDVALVLTPQQFHNYDPSCDIFNDSNDMFWNYILIGLDGWDNVSCTGTNFMLRAKAAHMVGWFPTYTLGEDMALALEIQKAGWKGAYLNEYLAVGEVPEGVRNTFMQKSRWAKGGMQIFFSKYNAMFDNRIPFINKLLWNIGGWSYLCGTITTPVFLTIPAIGVWLGYFPIVFNLKFAWAFTFYMAGSMMVLYYCRNPAHMRSIWFSQVAGTIFWFAYSKATVNTLMSALGIRNIKFKTTEKSNMAAGVADAANKAATKRKKSWAQETWAKVQDVWMPFMIFLLSTSTVVAGGLRMKNESHINSLKTLALLVSMGWSVYNMVAPYLLLHYWLLGKRGLKTATYIGRVVSFVVLIIIMIMIWSVLPNVYDYGEVLKLNFKFYAAQKSGALPADNPIPWRGNSALTDAAPNGASLAGGFYTDGGYVKYGLPLASAMSLLAWGLQTYPQGYAKAGATQGAKDTIRWAADYMVKCHTADFEYVAQVGSYEIDRLYYGRPENMWVPRPVYVINSTMPGSDLLGQTTAALAATAEVFATEDPAYSQLLLTHAQKLYVFATLYQGKYSDSVPNAAYLYPSSGYLDDLAWAAVWMYRATGEGSYLSDAESYYARQSIEEANNVPNPAVFNWDNLMPAVNLMLAKATNFQKSDYALRVENFLESWIDGKNGVEYTGGLLAWTTTEGPLRNAANAAFIARTYVRYSGKTWKYDCWAEAMVRYILGDAGRCYVVGYGGAWPLRVRHEAASCPGNFSTPCTVQDAYLTNKPNPNVLYGALVSGPMVPDDYIVDDRTRLSSRVALDYNAGLAGTLAALLELKHAGESFTHCTQGQGFIGKPIGRPV